MESEFNEVFEFSGFRLEPAERRLLKAGLPIAVPPKVFDLLVHLVRNRDRLIEKEELLRAIWPDSFVEESNLSVNVSALRKLLGEAPGESRFIETVPKKGYRFIAPLHSEVPAAPPAPPRSAPPRSVPPRSVPLNHPIWILAAAVCLLFATIWLLKERLPVSRPLQSVAVLPFLTLGSPEAPESLGLGIADAVTTRLSALGKIEVRSTALVSQFQKPGRDPLAVARKLDVDAVLDGRAQRSGDQLRLTAQLLRARDGRQIWAATFDSKFGDIFRLEDQIADEVAGVLVGRALADAGLVTKRGTTNPQAYQAYLQGQYLVSKRLHGATETAIGYFEKAIALDPGYALPHAAVAQAYLFRAGEGWGEAYRDRAKSAALRAISLDDQLAESQLALAQVLMRADWDWAGAERSFRRAIELQPNLAAAHAALSTWLTAQARHEEAIAEIRAACRMEPHQATWQADLAWTLLMAGKYDESVIEGLRAVDLDAWSYSARRQLAKAYLFESRLDESIQQARRAVEINGSRRQRVLAELAKALVAAGRTEEFEAIWPELLRPNSHEPYPHFEIAVVEAARGRNEAALAELHKAVEKRISRVLWLREDPELKRLRGEAKFGALVGKVGLRP